MNRTKLKNYAQQARRDFIQAMTDRAAYYGLTAKKTEPVVERGDVAVMGGREFPRAVAKKRKALEDRIQRHGFEQTMEVMAYTWFNRLVAIRFMELHGYLDHGYRVLSHPEGKPTPEILQYAEHIELPGLKKDTVIDLKLDGNKEADLYRLLLTAQCNALHRAMPFLFERIDDETELLLPDNLLHSDSLLRKLVSNLEAEDCESVEVLGWLYQFYISERKDQVMARKSAVPTEDIPAVTQLFTPHWIVRYLVENSLGRLWLLNRPGSRLREHMPYYIEGEPETDFLQISKPEDIRLLDPAVGSGHMLTYAFDLLTLIYEEEGYAPTEIPALILRHNLHGLEICSRAAQLAELALVFKAREKSRRFFQPEHLVRPHIIELRDVRFAENELRDYIHALELGDLFNQPMLKLLHQFEEAKNFGSLIQPCLDERAIAFARRAIEAKDLSGQLFLRETHLKVLRVLDQAEALTQRYHVVVANPPYMNANGFNGTLKTFTKANFQAGNTDLYGCFIERNLNLTIQDGLVGMITIPNWMFLNSFADLRAHLLNHFSIRSLVHNGRGVWGSDFGSCSFILENAKRDSANGVFKRLFDKQGEVNSNEELIAHFFDSTGFPNYFATTNQLRAVPGAPIAYWVTDRVRRLFKDHPPIADAIFPKFGMSNGDSAFSRNWWEVVFERIGFRFESPASFSGDKTVWAPYDKGGSFRKWFGNRGEIVFWKDNGRAIKAHPKSAVRNSDFFCRKHISWTLVSSSCFGVRYFEEGFVLDTASNAIYPKSLAEPLERDLAFLNTLIAFDLLRLLNPTVNFSCGVIGMLPHLKLPQKEGEAVDTLARECVSLARADWDNFETSWDFRDQPLLRPGLTGATLEASWRNWEAQSTAAIRRMQELETENNRLFIAAYGLDSELQPEVPEEQITLARAEARRDMAAFLSYAVGCMMGRYALDHPGLILANAGDTLREFLAKVGRPQAQLTFAPDEDGIIPVLDGEWFEDDLVARTRDFLRATFGEATLRENLRFIEDSLGKDLCSYFLSDFYKDHLQTYKKRPIYWLFSSGKQRAFQCLVYLHRYHEGTLARMRTEYVIPLQGKMAARITQLEGDSAAASSTAHRKKLEKERDTLIKQRPELQAFDEKLHHYADRRIRLDLDDGVKVNYGKFGDLLAEVKAVCGSREED